MGNTGEDRAENLGLLEKHNAEIIVIIKMIIIIIMITINFIHKIQC